jgi:hypothetical protein
MYKKGDIGYCVMWSDDDTKFEFWEYHLRTVQRRKVGYLQDHRVLYHYWAPKLKGTTWGKKSRKHGDFGWLPMASQFTSRFVASSGEGYPPTKVEACKADLEQGFLKPDQIKKLENYIKRYS